jgi:agmatine deiminase
MKTLNSTPSEDGFWMPAEFERHAGTWILWPERTDIWPFGAKPAQAVFVQMATTIAQFEHVTVGVSHSQFLNARQRLPDEIDVVALSYNGCWIRDTGPTFVIDGRGNVRGIDWKFNAWGGADEGLYFPWDLDDALPLKILGLLGIDRYDGPIVLEGGGIHADGGGTLLTTECCVLNRNRNPALTRQNAETIFADYLGISKTIWLKRGLYLDETGGHVDNICCFVRPGVVALAWTDDTSDPQYEISCEALDILSTATDANGRRLQVHKIVQPSPILIQKDESASVDVVPGTVSRCEGSRLPASYINYYVVNGGVIVPIFGDKSDNDVLSRIQELYPSRKVVPVNTRALLFGGGNIHCNVLQQPTATIRTESDDDK